MSCWAATWNITIESRRACARASRSVQTNLQLLHPLLRLVSSNGNTKRHNMDDVDAEIDGSWKLMQAQLGKEGRLGMARHGMACFWPAKTQRLPASETQAKQAHHPPGLLCLRLACFAYVGSRRKTSHRCGTAVRCTLALPLSPIPSPIYFPILSMPRLGAHPTR